MMFPLRRPAPEPLADVATRSVAVGSLSGVAPADVRANLLIVIDADGCLTMSGTACDELAMAMLTRAASLISKRVYDAHACSRGEP